MILAKVNLPILALHKGHFFFFRFFRKCSKKSRIQLKWNNRPQPLLQNVRDSFESITSKQMEQSSYAPKGLQGTRGSETSTVDLDTALLGPSDPLDKVTYLGSIPGHTSGTLEGLGARSSLSINE